MSQFTSATTTCHTVSPWVKTITVALTGASGMQYGLRLIECLLEAQVQVYVLISSAAQVLMKLELDFTMPTRPAAAADLLRTRYQAPTDQLYVFGRQQWSAPVASGSHPPDAMVVCPCTVATLASIAAGLSSDLIERAADVVIKERRPLILLLRETPLSVIHLENMLRLAHAGVIIMPASPGFYFHPRTVDDLVDFMVARLLDHLGIAHPLIQRWATTPALP